AGCAIRNLFVSQLEIDPCEGGWVEWGGNGPTTQGPIQTGSSELGSNRGVTGIGEGRTDAGHRRASVAGQIRHALFRYTSRSRALAKCRSAAHTSSRSC